MYRERERGCSTENRGCAGERERERERERTEDAQGRERERARELSFLARCVSHTRLAPTSICYGTFQRKEVKYKTTENFHFIFLPSSLLFFSFFSIFPSFTWVLFYKGHPPNLGGVKDNQFCTTIPCFQPKSFAYPNI